MKRALELILKDDVQKAFDCFASCFDIRILFFSPTGEILAAGRPRQANSPYCALVQERLFGRDRCLALDADRRREAAAKGRLVAYRCHAGLTEAVMPIYAAKHLLGFVMIGQIRSDPRPPAEVARAWARKSALCRLEAAWAALPFVPADKLDHVLGLFEILVNHIVSHHLIALKGDLLLAEVLAYIQAHLEEPVALGDAADFVGRSQSTLSHLFQKKLGRTFKRTVIEAKLDRAEQHMRAVPGITVAEAARAVGYSDPFHFSALYRKYRGRPPSEFLRRAATRNRR